MDKIQWEVTYVVGNTYKVKYIIAPDSCSACKKARVKNIVDLKMIAIIGS